VEGRELGVFKIHHFQYSLYREIIYGFIHLAGILCKLGYLPEEQVLGQWFEVDLTLWLDLSLRARATQ